MLLSTPFFNIFKSSPQTQPKKGRTPQQNIPQNALLWEKCKKEGTYVPSFFLQLPQLGGARGNRGGARTKCGKYLLLLVKQTACYDRYTDVA